MFDGDVENAYIDMKEKLEEDFLIGEKVIRVFKPVILEFGRLIPKKYCELLFGIEPTVTHISDSSKDKEIKKVLNKTNFFSML